MLLTPCIAYVTKLLDICMFKGDIHMQLQSVLVWNKWSVRPKMLVSNTYCELQNRGRHWLPSNAVVQWVLTRYNWDQLGKGTMNQPTFGLASVRDCVLKVFRLFHLKDIDILSESYLHYIEQFCAATKDQTCVHATWLSLYLSWNILFRCRPTWTAGLNPFLGTGNDYAMPVQDCFVNFAELRAPPKSGT